MPRADGSLATALHVGDDHALHGASGDAVIIPPTGNELISMLKTTSLVTACPIFTDPYSIASRDRRAIFELVPMLLVAATWYLVITSILMVGQYYLEKQLKGISR